MTRVLVSGYIGFENSGDDSILFALKKFITADNNLVLEALSKNPSMTKEKFGINTYYYMSPKQVIKGILSADIIVSGGGNLLQDGTSSRSLYYYGLIIFMAKLFGKKVMIYANGIGPLKSDFNEWFAKNTVRMSDLITVRENQSYQWLEKWRIKSAKRFLTADPVFTLYKPTPRSHNIESNGIINKRPLVIAISLRDHSTTQGVIEVLCHALNTLNQENRFHFLLIPLQQTRDLPVLVELQKGLKGSTTLINETYEHDQMMSLFQSADLVLGMRLHALIYSSLCEVPFIGLSYEPKVSYFAQTMDAPYFETDKVIDPNVFMKKIAFMIDNLTYFEEQIHSQLPQVIQSSEKNNLLLKTLIGKK